MDRRRLLGAVLAAASACGYGSGPLFAKSVYGAGLDWLALLFWRFLVGGLLVWAWALLFPDNRDGLRALSRSRILALLGLGGFFVMNAATYYAALHYVSASLAALIVYIYPAVVAVLSVRWGHGLHGRRPWVALGIVTAGVVLTVGGIRTDAEPIGIALIVSSPIIYSFYIILSARLAGERRGETAASRTGDAGAETRPAVAAALMLTGTFVVVAVLAVANGEPVLPGEVPADAWVGLLGIAVFSTALAVSAFYAGSARIGAAQAALVSTVEPVWTISLATMFFAESLAPLQLAGGALVLGGVLLAQTTPGVTPDVVVEEP